MSSVGAIFQNELVALSWSKFARKQIEIAIFRLNPAREQSLGNYVPSGAPFEGVDEEQNSFK